MEVKQHPNDMIYGKMNIKYNNMWIYKCNFLCVFFWNGGRVKSDT